MADISIYTIITALIVIIGFMIDKIMSLRKENHDLKNKLQVKEGEEFLRHQFVDFVSEIKQELKELRK